MDTLISQIWRKYDADENGYLGKDETRKFMADIMCDISPSSLMSAADDHSAGDGFDDIFEKIDIHRDGKICKKDMLVYLCYLGGVC